MKFGNVFATKLVMFGVNNSLSSHDDNRTNKFLLLDEGQTNYINRSVVTAEKKISINFALILLKQRQNFD